jgi:plasmid maintenance system antidote protein VapI
MKSIKEITELTGIVKDYIKKSRMTGYNFALLLGKDPAYLSRVLNNKHDISADMMLKILGHMGYEVVLMTKKEKNLLEKEAYAELAKEMGHFREEIREGVVNEIEHDIIKNISKFFREKGSSGLEKNNE